MDRGEDAFAGGGTGGVAAGRRAGRVRAPRVKGLFKVGVKVGGGAIVAMGAARQSNVGRKGKAPTERPVSSSGSGSGSTAAAAAAPLLVSTGGDATRGPQPSPAFRDIGNVIATGGGRPASLGSQGRRRSKPAGPARATSNLRPHPHQSPEADPIEDAATPESGSRSPEFGAKRRQQQQQRRRRRRRQLQPESPPGAPSNKAGAARQQDAQESPATRDEGPVVLDTPLVDRRAPPGVRPLSEVAGEEGPAEGAEPSSQASGRGGKRRRVEAGCSPPPPFRLDDEDRDEDLFHGIRITRRTAQRARAEPLLSESLPDSLRDSQSEGAGPGPDSVHDVLQPQSPRAGVGAGGGAARGTPSPEPHTVNTAPMFSQSLLSPCVRGAGSGWAAATTTPTPLTWNANSLASPSARPPTPTQGYTEAESQQLLPDAPPWPEPCPPPLQRTLPAPARGRGAAGGEEDEAVRVGAEAMEEVLVVVGADTSESDIETQPPNAGGHEAEALEEFEMRDADAEGKDAVAEAVAEEAGPAPAARVAASQPMRKARRRANLRLSSCLRHSFTVTQACFSEGDGGRLLGTTDGATVLVWEEHGDTWDIVFTSAGQEDTATTEIAQLGFAPARAALVAGGRFGTTGDLARVYCWRPTLVVPVGGGGAGLEDSAAIEDSFNRFEMLGDASFVLARWRETTAEVELSVVTMAADWRTLASTAHLALYTSFLPLTRLWRLDGGAVLGATKQRLLIWDTRSGDCRAIVDTEDATCLGVIQLADAVCCVMMPSGGPLRTVSLAALVGARSDSLVPLGTYPVPLADGTGQPLGAVTTAALGGHLLAIGLDVGCVLVFDALTASCTEVVWNECPNPALLAFHGPSATLAVAGHDGEAHVHLYRPAAR